MGTLMWRWNFGLALAGNKQPGAGVDLRPLAKALSDAKKGPDVATWFSHFVGRKPTQEEQEAISLTKETATDAVTESRRIAGLILASPAFQRC